MSVKLVFIYALAIFAMFFGSGNLVFPLQIGVHAGTYWGLSFFGLLLTGIFLPFLGLFVIKLHKGDYNKFFNEGGGVARVVLPLFTLSLLGSFGVVPRCIAVAHGGVSYINADWSLIVFSAIFCITTFVLCLKDQIMINVLGKWMSPLLVLALFTLIIMGIFQAPHALPTTTPSDAFKTGFLTGYQTMDLFAAFFFSALIFSQIKLSLPKNTPDRQIIKLAVLPSIIGSSMLALVYLGFVYLGSHYASHLHGVDPEMLLPSIVMFLMGNNATMLIALVMVLSCLTTAVALNNIYARYLCSMLKLNDKYFPIMLFMTTLVSFIISLLDFRGIAAFLGPALEISYPGMIALGIMSIAFKDQRPVKMVVFWSITFLMIAISPAINR